MLIQEQIRKKVTSFGNGSIVYTPKAWIGREVIVTLPRLSLKEEILRLVEPNLEHIRGIYIYGSYARNEQDDDSDVDVLVVSDKKFEVQKDGYDVNIHKIENLRRILVENPLYSLILKEAKVILNNSLLDELKDTKSKKDFSFILNTTKNVLEINKQFIDMEEDKFDNPAVVYSLVLRLRGLYMIDCILKNKLYFNKDFKKFAASKGIKNFNLLYKIYRYERDNKKLRKTYVSKDEINKLYLLVKDETEKKSAKIN